MNRAIKVRAWDTAAGRFLHSYELSQFLHVDSDGSVYYGDSIPPFNCRPETTVILTQFTGLLDKNGAEIYENDIIKDKRAFVWTVRWNRGLAQFAAHWHNAEKAGSNKEWRYWDSIAAPCVEVLGNIYENPKLVMEG